MGWNSPKRGLLWNIWFKNSFKKDWCDYDIWGKKSGTKLGILMDLEI